MPIDPDQIPHRKSRHGFVVNVRVEPRSSKACVVGVIGEALKVKLTASPVGGAANKQLIDVLSNFFRVRKGDVRILRGHASKKKVVEVVGVLPHV